MAKHGGIRSRARLLLSAVAVMAAAALLPACDGGNLFEGEVTEEGPTITTLSVPQSIATGEEFDVEVTATAPRGVQFIEVVVTGAATDSVRANFDGEQVAFLSFPVTASSALGSQITVRAFVRDINGRPSSVRSETITVTGVTTGVRSED
jgi:hypothetical protein